MLAHEFGHFSQRSMKFGSYVYNLNKIIYNMLYENNAYGDLLDKWASVHFLFRITVIINIKIIKGIQWILQKIYVYINKSYLRLSREMEFHADAIAAVTAGSNNAITASRRIQIGQSCLDTTLDYWSTELINHKRARNIYPQQAEIIKQYALELDIPLDSNGLPFVNNPLPRINSQQVVIKDQWSSHPSNEDREAELEKINIIKPSVDEPAWNLFKDKDNLQLLLTDQLYASVTVASELKKIDIDEFKQMYYQYIDDNSYSKPYKGFYNQRTINTFDVDEAIALAITGQTLPPLQLLTNENINLPGKINFLEFDISVADSIISNTDKSIKTFDFRGEKYTSNQALQVKNILIAELEDARKKLAETDKQLFIAFYNAAQSIENKQRLENDYRRLFDFQASDIEDYKLHNEIITTFNPVYSIMSCEDIEATLANVYKLETPIKQRLKEILNNSDYTPALTNEWKISLEKYLSKNYVYFENTEYENEAISIFNDAMTAYGSIVSERTFRFKKKLFEFQLLLVQ